MKINIGSNEIIHFVGIGGIGMSGLAQVMSNMGFKIQGSDINQNKKWDKGLDVEDYKDETDFEEPDGKDESRICPNSECDANL